MPLFSITTPATFLVVAMCAQPPATEVHVVGHVEEVAVESQIIPVAGRAGWYKTPARTPGQSCRGIHPHAA